jgi:hypothetical protein
MRRRVLSRAEARRKLKAAKHAIDALFQAADRGLFIPPTPPGSRRAVAALPARRGSTAETLK